MARETRRVVTGQVQALAAGSPAVLVCAGACALAFQIGTTGDDRRISRYLLEAARSTETREFDTALVCYERLIKDLGGRPEHRYAYAMALYSQGDRDRARALLTELAPADSPGYLPAHMAMARIMLRGSDRSERTKRLLELHLKQALDGPDGNEAGALLGRLYAETGRGTDAEFYLLRAAQQHPELHLLLARLAHDRGENSLADERLERARRVFQTRAEARVDDPEARLLWASAVANGNDFAGAVAILEQGLKISASPRYHQGLAEIYAGWVNHLGRGGATPPLGDRLALLGRGLKHDPNNVPLLNQMAMILLAKGPEAESARAELQSLLASGKATPATHFVLGVDANARGRNDEARLHWEQAVRLDPRMAVVANNLAWVLAHAEPPDLARALALAERAVQGRPDEARFRGTRGVVLMKLGRWHEALTDLEAELAAHPDLRETHGALAQVYETLGSPELAAKHRARAQTPGKAKGG
jgi:tetratricopeptide (TPR) repeat protein